MHQTVFSALREHCAHGLKWQS
eukprot:SAG31_NODE_39273_length_289_cov_1.284211_2_plen_21_part_01